MYTYHERNVEFIFIHIANAMNARINIMGRDIIPLCLKCSWFIYCLWLNGIKNVLTFSFKQDQGNKGIKGIISGLRIFQDTPPIQKNENTFVPGGGGFYQQG